MAVAEWLKLEVGAPWPEQLAYDFDGWMPWGQEMLDWAEERGCDTASKLIPGHFDY